MQKVIKTVVTERLGIKYPIISGTMQWISRAELVAAVSNAGCLGILSSATFAEVEELRAEIRKVKALTDKPFAVNMTFLPSLIVQDREAQLRCIAEEGVKIIETSGLIPADNLIKIIKNNNMTWIHKCTIVKHAQGAALRLRHGRCRRLRVRWSPRRERHRQRGAHPGLCAGA